METGIELIAAERKRLASKHDGKMVAPASRPMGAAAAAGFNALIEGRIRQHVETGALCAAEIDRLQRMRSNAGIKPTR